MRVNEAKLRAYLDGELPAPDRARVEAHLAGSSRAQALLARLRRDRELVTRAMDQLGPPAGTFAPAWLVLKRLRSGVATSEQPAPAPLPDEATRTTWESPTLFSEIKAVFSNLTPKWRQPMSQFVLGKRLSLIVFLALVLLVVAAVFAWPVDFGGQLGWRLDPWLEPRPGVSLQPTATPTALPAEAQLPADVTPVSAVFGDEIELVGYKLPATISAGGSLDLTLYWRVLQLPAANRALFVHLFDQEDNLLVGQDTPFKNILTGGQPLGRIITDQRRLTGPDGPGVYHIAVGLYDNSTGQRLNAYLDGRQLPDAMLYLYPEFEVVPTTVLTTSLVLALQPISQGTEIAPGMVGLREWPANHAPPGAMSSEDEVIGKMTRTPIVQGQVIVSKMLLDQAETVNYELKSVRQLTPCENKGRRQLFVRVQAGDKQGLDNVPVKILWQAAPEESIVLDTENIGGDPGRLEYEMGPGVYSVEVVQGVSHVAVVNTAHFEAEEPCNGGPGNAPGRGSYEIIFERVEPVPTGHAADLGHDYGLQADPRGDTAVNIEHLRTLGFGWVKLRMPWKEVEPLQGRYSWEPWDEVISAYAAADIRVLLNVVHAPDWARPDDDDRGVEGLPADPATYADFVARVAERYQGRVQAIEIWNEQNLWYKVGGRERMDAARYVRLLQPAYEAIKAVDRDMIVVSGGLSPAGDVGELAVDDFDYLQEMYDSGVKGYFDALGVYAWGFNCPALADWRTITPEEATADPDHGLFRNRHHSWCFLGTLLGHREIMAANGDADTPVWVTEFGWAVANETIPGFEYARDNTPEEQAQWIIEAYDWAEEQDWVGPLFLWNLDYGMTAPDTELALFGLLNTPAYEALLERYQERLNR